MASTQQNTTFLQNNIQKQASKSKVVPSGLTRKEDQNGRRTLQTLQYSSLGGKNSLHQMSKTKEKKQHIQNLCSTKQQVTIFEDPKSSGPIDKKSFDDKAVQTEEKNKQRLLSCEDAEDIDQEAYDLMVNEDIPETYWKHLAEERREALNDSLHENETLYKEIDELKEENVKLSQLASQAEYFAAVIKDILGDNKEEKLEEVVSDSCEEVVLDSCDKGNNECISEHSVEVSNCEKDIVDCEESELDDKGDNSSPTNDLEDHANKTDQSEDETGEVQAKDESVSKG